jgi:hypothetical protein
MTEPEWMACADPAPMLAFLRDRASDRKLQLFACACCRRLYGLFPNALIRRAVEFGEQDADGMAEYREMIEADAAVSSWLDSQNTCARESDLTSGELSAVRVASGLTNRRPMARVRLAGDTARSAARAVHAAANDREAVRRAPAGEEVRVARATWLAAESACRREQQAQAALLRDIMGNPFRPTITEPLWIRPDVLFLAQTLYDERCWDQLPNLADALRDAGHDDEELLAHLRSDGPHVLGCWALDRILGKE